MPRPPILPLIDWKEVFDMGRKYPAWFSLCSTAESKDKLERMHQLVHLEPQVAAFLGNLPRTVHVVAIAEDWCGDVIRHVPVLQRIAEAAPHMDVHYISRELRPEVLGRFLTNGGEAIPKFIFLNDAWVECGNWGPMPALCREIIARGKACGDIPAARKKVAALYEADHNCRMVIEELVHLIDIACSREP